MASAAYSEDLVCPACQTIFTDPVTLPCGHSLCRGCVRDVRCPLCRAAVPSGCLPSSHTLRSLAEKAKGGGKRSAGGWKESAESAELCPEHEERLKLFCVTDHQLACTICRDGEKHEGHKFKPIKEAAASLLQQLEKGVDNLCVDTTSTQSLANSQREGIRKNKEKTQQLTTQIHRQFEEMHQFLRKREDEIKNDLKYKEEDAAEEMRKSLNAIETVLSESRELGKDLASLLVIEDPGRFLKSWTERKSRTDPEDLFRLRTNDLKVVNPLLSLGPYESHLQFFMWKEMLKVIQPKAELLSLKSDSANITLSHDRRSLFSTESIPAPSGYSSPSGTGVFGQPGFTFKKGHRDPFGYHQSRGFGPPTYARTGQTTASSNINHVFSANEFTSGQHYWETEVGHRDYWELGVNDHFLKCDGKIYAYYSPNKTTQLQFGGRPRKIGIYLNCASKKLSFYDADNMKHIHTDTALLMSTPVSAYFNVRATEEEPNPMTVCWY